MLPLPSPTTRLPGSSRYDLFPEPDLNSNEFVKQPTDILSQPKLVLDQFALKTKDLVLESALNSIGKSNLTRDGQSVTVETTEPISQSLLSTIKLYPAQYPGRVTPQSTYSCQLVAGKLQDSYDPAEKRFSRHKFLDHDYLGLIAQEEQAGRMLVAFDSTFVLPAIVRYITEGGSYDAIRTQKLREQVQELNPVVSPGGDQYIQWVSNPDLPPAQPFSISSLQVYAFQDELYMVFAPIGVEEATRFMVYLNVNVKLYSYDANIAIESLPKARGLDFQHLFPVKLGYVGSFTIVSSNQLTGEQMELALQSDRISFVYPKVDELRGVFAVHLMAEALFFEFPLRWEKGRFVVGMVGYIQAQDINQQLARILTQLSQTRLEFTPVDNFQSAVELARTTDVKCFYYHGRYYAVTSTQNAQKSTQEPVALPDEETITLLEMKGPLEAVADTRLAAVALQYWALLGYDTNPNPIPYRNQIKLGYRTYQDGQRIFTIYYYTSTNGEDREVHEIDGPHHEEVRRALEHLLNLGYFSTQRFRNITRGYPGFVPSDQPIHRNLARNVRSLLVELENLRA